MIRVVHPDPELIGLINPKLSQVKLADLFGIDEGVIVRLDQDSIVLMPHGGIAITRMISSKLDQLGVAHQEQTDPEMMYPEARSQIEAWMLYAISQAQSPLAVEVLLEHNQRWSERGVERVADVGANQVANEVDSKLSSSLDRLIQPPIVAAVGRANVGKSTLINAIAGDHVAIVADVAGTTRDHVGVHVDLGGLVVRWIDTPGIDERIGDGDDIEIATRVIGQADLVVHCIDPADEQGELDPRIADSIAAGTHVVRLGTRSDMSEHRVDVDLLISIGEQMRSGQIELFVEHIRESLVPRTLLEGVGHWRFWDALS